MYCMCCLHVLHMQQLACQLLARFPTVLEGRRLFMLPGGRMMATQLPAVAEPGLVCCMVCVCGCHRRGAATCWRVAAGTSPSCCVM